MIDESRLVDDAVLLASYALSMNVPLPDDVADVLLDAAGNREKIREGGAERAALWKAFRSATAVVGKSVSEIRAEQQRVERLRPLVGEAEQLLKYAATNGRKIDDDIRDGVVGGISLVDAGSPTLAQEQAFMKAYEGITVALAPITVETLKASTVQFPGWTIWRTLEGRNAFTSWFISRFFNVAAFGAMLLLTCVALGYYYQGTSSISRLKELQDMTAKLESDRLLKETAFALAKQAKDKDGGDVAAALKTLLEAERSLDSVMIQLNLAWAELSAIPERLYKWSSSPCEPNAFWVTELALCSEADRKSIEEERKAREKAEQEQAERIEELKRTSGTAEGKPSLWNGLTLSVPGAFLSGKERPLKYAQVEQARTVASRLSDVYLPLLLGWLGAHAFVLRRMSKDIMTRTLARGSGFNHVARIGLGALAGLASTWLLTPESVSTLLTSDTTAGSQFKKLPIWGLAFVAGYGIELVFAFMDRILAAFTGKETGATSS